MGKKDTLSALFWLLFSAFILKEGSRIPFGTLSRPMPGFFPLILGIILGILSFILLGKSLLKGKGEESRIFSGRKGWNRVVLTLGMLLAYYLLLESIGFLLAAFFLVFVLIKFIEPHPWFHSAWVSTLISIGAYFLFQVVLKANLPQGMMKGLGF